MGAAALQAHCLQNICHTVTNCRRRSQRQIDNPKGNAQTASRFPAYQFPAAGYFKGGMLNGGGQFIKRRVRDFTHCVEHYTRTADAHIEYNLRLSYAMKSACHKRIVLHCIAENHQFGTAQAVFRRCQISALFDHLPHQTHCIHVDARSAGAHVDRSADKFCFCQSLRNGANQLFIALGHPFLYQSGKSADKVYAHFLGRRIHRFGDFHIVRRLTSVCYDRNRRHGNPFINNRDAVILRYFFPHLHQILSVGGNFFINLFTHHVDIAMGTVPQGNAHGNCANIQIF